VLLGLPVLTADYDVWMALEDIERFNDAVERFDLVPTCSADEARRRGRYALENDEHVDVLVARAVQTVAGVLVAFDDLWETRRSVTVADAVVYLPSLEGLILTRATTLNLDRRALRGRSGRLVPARAWQSSYVCAPG
jgi:hypothetical protein